KRVGGDVARFGDDRTVLFPRQGMAGFHPVTMRHARNSSPSVDIANRTMAMMNADGVDEAFFDDTGGWAHGAVDILRSSGRQVHAVQFDAPSANPQYLNMRAQMWWEMAEWVKGAGCLPH